MSSTQQPVPVDPAKPDSSKVTRPVDTEAVAEAHAVTSSDNPEPPEVAAAPVGSILGHYVRIRRLASGGMGDVWKAWDRRLGRWVALKILKQEEESEFARFQREAQIASRLTHPNIAAIYEVGEQDGKHFIALQLINGRTLEDLPDKNRRFIVELVRDAARGIGYAHSEGIVHRDIKPANLMVESRPRAGGEGQAVWEHQVYVMDFGVARPLYSQSNLTQAGFAVGTPVYMPPEQARGEVVNATADVYALGATLYEILLGRPPIQGADIRDTLMAIQTREPVPPRLIDPEIEPDLESIILKCLEKEKSARYRDASELAEDLDRFLNNHEVVARPQSLTYKVQKFVKRNRGIAMSVAVGVLVLLATAGVVVPVVMRQLEAKTRAERALKLGGRVSTLLAEAEAYSRSGEAARSRAKLEEGIGLCREALAKGEFAEAHAYLGRLLRARGNRGGARQELNRALELDPELTEARLERGLLLVEEYTDRMVALRQYVMTNYPMPGPPRQPTAGEVESYFPDLRSLRGLAEKDLVATRAEGAVLRQGDMRYAMAELTRMQGNSNGARTELQAIVDADPLHARALHALACIADQNGETDRALEYATRAIDAHRGFGEAYLTRARLRLWKAGLAPEASSAHLEALADANRAIDLGIETAEAWTSRGTANWACGSLDKAISDYTRAIDANRTSAVPWSLRAGARFTARDFKGAAADYAEATRLAERNGAAWLGLGASQLELGLLDDAINSLNNALQLIPSSLEALYTRAQAHEKKGNRDKAIEDYTRSLELAPATWGGREIVEARLKDLTAPPKE